MTTEDTQTQDTDELVEALVEAQRVCEDVISVTSLLISDVVLDIGAQKKRGISGAFAHDDIYGVSMDGSKVIQEANALRATLGTFVGVVKTARINIAEDEKEGKGDGKAE